MPRRILYPTLALVAALAAAPCHGWILVTSGASDAILCFEGTCEDVGTCVEGDCSWDCLDVVDQDFFSTCTNLDYQHSEEDFETLPRTIGFHSDGRWQVTVDLVDDRRRTVGSETLLVAGGTTTFEPAAGTGGGRPVAGYEVRARPLDGARSAQANPLILEPGGPDGSSSRVTLEGSLRPASSFDALGAERREEKRFSLGLAAGVAGLNGFDVTEDAYSVTPRLTVLRGNAFDVDLTLPMVYIPGPRQDPWWKGLCEEGIRLPPCPLDEPLRLDGDDLQVGSLFAVSPSVEVVFRPRERWSPSLFAGVGFFHEEGRSHTVSGIGAVRTSDNVQATVSWGGALAYRLSPSARLRLEARWLRSFSGEMTVTGPTGRTGSAEGGTFDSAFVSLGPVFEF